MRKTHVSLNEIEVKAYRALEALDYSEGLCVIASGTLRFLEAININVMQQFSRFLMLVENLGNRPSIPSLSSENTDSSTIWSFDFSGQSCLHYIDVITECMVAKIHAQSLESPVTILLKNSFDYIFLFPTILRISKCQLSIQWPEGDGLKLISMVPGRKYPDFFSAGSDGAHEGKVMVYKSAGDFKAHLDEHFEIRMRAEDFDELYQQNIKKGVMLSQEHWEIVQGFAKKVLVSDSETSQRGAGESKNPVGND